MAAGVTGAERACGFVGPSAGAGPSGAAVSPDQAFERLERLYGQLPAMEAKGAALARARAAAEVDRLARTAAYRGAELARADAQVAEAEKRVAVVLGAGAEGAGAQGACGSQGGDGNAAEDARRALMAAGTWRGLRVGPARNAERALALALEASPFATVEEARAALLPGNSLDTLAAEVETYQRDYAEALAACQQLEGAA